MKPEEPAPPRSPLVLIPARMAATRLPQKPLADIGGAPMIVHVLRRGQEAGIGPVVVACDDPAIARAVEADGGRAVLTRPDHASGSDRIFEALEHLDPHREHDSVVNLQGDLPTLAPHLVRAAFNLLLAPGVDIGTLGVAITDPAERDNPNVVKAVAEIPEGARRGRALYFSRVAAPSGPGPHYHHVGIYAWRRRALERFVTAPPAMLERREKLEQLRALALGMHIELGVVDTVPLGVDTPEDLTRARLILARG